jgi:hypothetical protein
MKNFSFIDSERFSLEEVRNGTIFREKMFLKSHPCVFFALEWLGKWNSERFPFREIGGIPTGK